MTALDVSRIVISYFTKRNRPITNLKLQKILYYIQKDFLQNLGYPAFEEEIQAWRHGPVVPSIYDEYKRFVAMPIIQSSINTDDVNPEELNHISQVCNRYLNVLPWDMVQKTHSEKAWRSNYVEGENNPIPIESIQ